MKTIHPQFCQPKYQFGKFSLNYIINRRDFISTTDLLCSLAILPNEKRQQQKKDEEKNESMHTQKAMASIWSGPEKKNTKKYTQKPTTTTTTTTPKLCPHAEFRTKFKYFYQNQQQQIRHSRRKKKRRRNFSGGFWNWQKYTQCQRVDKGDRVERQKKPYTKNDNITINNIIFKLTIENWSIQRL